MDECGVYYDSYDEAREAAESNIDDCEIPTDEYPSDRLYLIKAGNVEIVEFDDEEVQYTHKIRSPAIDQECLSPDFLKKHKIP